MSSYSANITRLSLLLCYTLSLQGESLSETIQRVIPSVVKIKVQRSDTAPSEENELISVDSGGSGFVFDDNHHIVTNAHVITDAKKIIIVDQNNKEYQATLIGKDYKTDIAVLESKSFTAPVLKDNTSDKLGVGDKVFAIGSPYSLGHSSSYGIISANERILTNYPYLKFIQTDAAINPGNSGGPLFNENGELVGMNSTYFQKQGNYTNIGFTIPIQDVRRIGKKLLENKKINRGFMGADLVITERYFRKMGYQNGILVTRTIPGSPSAKSGLLAGDIIVKISEKELADQGEFHRVLEESNINDVLSISVIRNKELINLKIKLDVPIVETKEITNAGTGDASEKLGLILAEKNNSVEVITTYSIAKNIGITSKDIIVDINGNHVKSIAELNTHVGKLKELELSLLTIERDGKQFTLPIGSKIALKISKTEN